VLSAVEEGGGSVSPEKALCLCRKEKRRKSEFKRIQRKRGKIPRYSFVRQVKEKILRSPKER